MRPDERGQLRAPPRRDAPPRALTARPCPRSCWPAGAQEADGQCTHWLRGGRLLKRTAPPAGPSTTTPGPCPCPRAGRPCHGFHAGTTDLRNIDSWWTTSPDAGVGVACEPANLIVIDIDAHSAPVPDRSRLLPGIQIHDSVDLDGLASRLRHHGTPGCRCIRRKSAQVRTRRPGRSRYWPCPARTAQCHLDSRRPRPRPPPYGKGAGRRSQFIDG
ncbi:bifunctional DNA primase/polymerase [Streptomyces anulatus]|uniref:bifunctional DNA primase/polymerase n=1 Tax=Streptomyces anulatus TaxID=1892 RepID=UPI0038657E95